jgi:hypothetical protein
MSTQKTLLLGEVSCSIKNPVYLDVAICMFEVLIEAQKLAYGHSKKQSARRAKNKH